MKLGIHITKEAASAPQWVDFDMKDYEKNLLEPEEKRIKFLIRPQTRAAITRVERQAEAQKKQRSKYAEGAAEMPDGTNDAGDRFTRELANYLVEDWKNVSDTDGNDLECNKVNKIWLFENIDFAVWAIEAAKEIASVRIEEEQKN